MNEKSDFKYWNDRVLGAKGDPQSLVYADAGKFKRCTEVSEALIKTFVRQGNSVLDVGCGYGRFYNAVKAAGGLYTGIDFSEEMIKEANRQNPGGVFYCTRWENDEIGLYDIVFQCICRSSFDGEDDDFLNMLMSHLKPGGLLISVEPNTCFVKSNEGNIFER